MVVINSKLAAHWLRRPGANVPRMSCCFVIPDHFRRCFEALLDTFSFGAERLHVYSLRHGGATWDFLSHQSMERTLLAGH